MADVSSVWLFTSGEVSLACLLVHDSAIPTTLDGMAAVTLGRRHQLVAAVAMPVVVPVRKLRHQLAGFLLTGKWQSWVVWPIFRVAEQGYRARVSFDTRGLENDPSTNAQFFQPSLRHALAHRVAVVRM